MTVQAETHWRPDLRAPIVLGLAGLLLVQLLLALGLGLGLGGGRAMTPVAADAPLLDFAPKAVRSIRIESGDGTEPLTLTRADEGWTLASLADAPVQGDKVDQLLDGLIALRQTLPIATTEAAHTRFKVADDAFERRLTLEGDQGALASLLIGDSPGFRRVFARRPESAGVQDLRLALSDVSNRRDDWVDTGLLRLERDRIARIAAADWTLTKGEDGAWSLADTEQPLDRESIEALVLRVANLSYRGILGVADDPAYAQGSPLLELQIGIDDGTTRHYRISQAQDSQDYVLKDQDRPWYFKLSEFDLGELKDTTRADLIAAPAPGEPDATQTENGIEAGQTEPAAAETPAPEIAPDGLDAATPADAAAVPETTEEPPSETPVSE